MKSLKELMHWYETLTPETLANIQDYYDKDAFFKDPFNEIKGREKIEHIFQDMFLKLTKPHFVFIDIIEQDDQAFLTWDFIFTIKSLSYTIHGSSHLKLNQEKLVIYHRDYWDVGEELLLKIPLLKNLYSLFRKNFKAA